MKKEEILKKNWTKLNRNDIRFEDVNFDWIYDSMEEYSVMQIKKVSLYGVQNDIYDYLKINKTCGVREIQKHFNLSSSSLASHHLNKMRSKGFVYQLSNRKYALLEN